MSDDREIRIGLVRAGDLRPGDGIRVQGGAWEQVIEVATHDNDQGQLPPAAYEYVQGAQDYQFVAVGVARPERTTERAAWPDTTAARWYGMHDFDLVETQMGANE